MTIPSDAVDAREPSTTALVTAAAVLAVAAGFVDAVVFLHVVATFPANQSGNAVFLGLSIGGTSPAPGWAPPVAMASFVAGAAVGRWLSRRARRGRGPAALLALESLLLAALAVALVVRGGPEPFATTVAKASVLAVAALAMGIQTDVIRAAAGVAVSTTYQTGAMARIGQTIGGPRVEPGPEQGRRLVGVLLVVLVAYVGGAALGAGPLGAGRASLFVPVVLVAALHGLARARPWS